MSHSKDTIYALSSGSLPAGVAVLRISGSEAMGALQRLINDEIPPPRKAALKKIRSRNGDVIDEALVLSFPGPNSFTGEDCVEIHVHGSRAVVQAVFKELEDLPGLRAAEAGEFSKRAFDNGKMDLVEVEGLADLLHAETEMQRRLAVEQSSGQLSQLYDNWATKLTRCRALIEAELDFADEDDVPDSVAAQVWDMIEILERDISHHLANGAGSEIIRDGFKVALVGAPNVGKSSLMNALSGRDVAIVTEIAGTTRDVLSVDLDIGGYLVTLFDTAGIRETDDIVEREGVRRTTLTAQSADLLLLLSDNESYPRRILPDGAADVDILKIRTKSDLLGEVTEGQYDHDLAVSARNQEGLSTLLSSIKSTIENKVGTTGTLIPARLRHKKRLDETLFYVREALAYDGMELAVRSEYLRLAATALGRITGRVDIEELLGVIFSEFCIGK